MPLGPHQPEQYVLQACFLLCYSAFSCDLPCGLLAWVITRFEHEVLCAVLSYPPSPLTCVCSPPPLPRAVLCSRRLCSAFSCILCCFETHLKVVAKTIAANFGFLYNAKGRAVFLIL